jgi:hypothetical protein
MSQDKPNPRPANVPLEERGIVTEVVVPMVVGTGSNVLASAVTSVIKKKRK